MDTKLHGRYLTYLEKWEYFKTPTTPRYSFEQWASLDKELTKYLDGYNEKTSDEDTRNKVKALRRALFRD